MANLCLHSCYILRRSKLSHLVATLEHIRTSLSLDDWVTALDWQPACVVPIHSFPPCSLASCLPRLCTLLFGWCCHGTMWPEWGFTYSILCSLHRGQLTRDWEAVTQNTEYTKAAVWTGTQDSAALSNSHGVTVPSQQISRGTFVYFTALGEFLFWPPSPFLTPFDQRIIFLSRWLLFPNATIFLGTKLGFSLILCTSMDTSGSVVSMQAEEQSLHVRYR